MTLPENSEPSVLDYIKSKIFPGRNPVVEIPDEDGMIKTVPSPDKKIKTRSGSRTIFQPVFFLIIALFVMLIGQSLLEPPYSTVSISLVFTSSGIIWILYGWFSKKFDTNLYPYVDEEPQEQVFRPNFFFATIGFAIAAMLMFQKNRFTGINLTLWIISITMLIATFFPVVPWKEKFAGLAEKVKQFFLSGFRLSVSPWTMVCLLVFALVTFFRFYRLNEVPGEMISDHAEKLLDVYDVLHGSFSIFFIRNTGREAFQMYLSALMAIIFGTGISFMTLKLGTAIMGLLTAVYMYFLGKEIGNRYVGLFAFLLCGIGYWPNIISRIGLRFTLYSAFTAMALLYFFRGFRRKKWFDLILAGFFIGIGLQGYSPFRVVPGLIFIGVCLYFIHYWKTGHQKFASYGLIFTGFAAFILFLPLFRYIVDQPDWFLFRTLTRAGEFERPLPGPAWQIFLMNFWRAVIMPFWRNGTIWVHSVPSRPALDVVTAVLYLIGLVTGILRYIQTRDWRIPFLILAVPFLMLPSIFSLAFPDENPCLNRTSGALVPIFLIAALGMDTFLQNIKKMVRGVSGTWLSGLLASILILISISQNYNLVFKEYNRIYFEKSLNTSDIGRVIQDFVGMYGDPDSAYVVGYPYWVDTRLVGMNAGYPIKDYAIWPDAFPDTVTDPRAKMFILNTRDTKSLEALRKLYPDHFETIYQGRIENKNFVIFIVHPAENSEEEAGTKAP
ncbi:hypothetical protein hrd7_29800 [Leptolinea sp. HRD-7]|nr:hypothetical protein hrd7_29800 [Leptolinea sp. HRD-7]